MTSLKTVWMALIAVAIIAVIGLFTPVRQMVSETAGGITTGSNFTHGISVGNTATLGIAPTNFSKILGGTCSLIMSSYSVTASTSVAADCAITGVVSTDTVLAQLATSTPSTAGEGWFIAGASASSTPGFVTFRLTNRTGGTAIIPASLASSTSYLVWGTQ